MSATNTTHENTSQNTTNGEQTQASAGVQESLGSWKFRLRLMGALAMPVFLETLDYTVVATAQPHIASAFNRLDLQSWIGTTYVLTSTVFLPIFASLADIFGRHWALQISLILFLLGCALSTGAQNIAMMLVGRGIAGVGAAGQLTVVRTILSDSASLDANNWQAAILVILYAVGFSVGPVIGGVLTDVNFRWVFAINLPCAAVSMFLCFFLLRGKVKGPQPRRRKNAQDGRPTLSTVPAETLPEKIARVDSLGGFLFIAAGILVLLALSWGSTSRWDDPKVIASFVVGGVCVIAFVAWEWFAARDENDGEIAMIEKGGVRRHVSWSRPEVMIPLGLFQNYDVCVTQFAAFTSGMVMLVNFYFVAIYFTIVLGRSPSDAGLQLIFFAPGMGVGTIAAIRLIKRLRQPKIPIIIGSVIIPIGVGLLSSALASLKPNDKTPIPGTIAGFLVMTGAGVGLTFGPLAIHARFSQPDDRVAIVVALNLFFRTFGGTVGLAQCSAVLYAKVRASITNALMTDPQISQADVVKLISLGNFNSLNDISGLSPHLQTVVQNAFKDGAKWAFISIIPWSGLAAILVLFLSKIPDNDLKRMDKKKTEENNTSNVAQQ